MTDKQEHRTVKIVNDRLRVSKRVVCRYAMRFGGKLTLLAMLLLFGTSCSQYDAIPIEPEGPELGKIAIDFSGTLASYGWKYLSSRAQVENRSDDQFYAEDIIGVFAFEIENFETSLEITHSTNIMHNKPLELNTGGEWEYIGDTAYWPNTNGSYVKFLAIYPHSSYSNGQVTASAYKSNTPTTIEIVPDGTTDIRISDLTEAYSRVTINGDKVPLVFRHLLQKVVVTFHTDDNSDYSGTVGYIVFKDKKRKYTYTFPDITSETRDTGECLSVNGTWSVIDNGSDVDYIKIKADVKLDKDNHEMISHSIAYLPPLPDVLDNMYVIIDGIDYPVQTPSIENAKSGQSINISLNISTVEKEFVCKVTDWKIETNDEETIY